MDQFFNQDSREARILECLADVIQIGSAVDDWLVTMVLLGREAYALGGLQGL